MSKQPFEKFINQKPVGAKKREIIRQDKKKARAETRAIADEIRRKNAEKYQVVTKETRKTSEPASASRPIENFKKETRQKGKPANSFNSDRKDSGFKNTERYGKKSDEKFAGRSKRIQDFKN